MVTRVAGIAAARNISPTARPTPVTAVLSGDVLAPGERHAEASGTGKG